MSSTPKFEIVGSVAKEEVPDGARRNGSPWAALAQRVMDDHADGRVTVVKTRDERDVERIRHNVANYLHKSELSPRPVVVKGEGGEIRIFIEVVEYKPNGPRRQKEDGGA